MTDIMLNWDGHWNGPGGWGGPWWGLATLLVVAAVATAGFVVLRRGRPATAGAGSAAGARDDVARDDAEQVLATRFARGEIDEDEYTERLAVIRGNRWDD